jgi:hypothetical protein
MSGATAPPDFDLSRYVDAKVGEAKAEMMTELTKLEAKHEMHVQDFSSQLRDFSSELKNQGSRLPSKNQMISYIFTASVATVTLVAALLGAFSGGFSLPGMFADRILHVEGDRQDLTAALKAQTNQIAALQNQTALLQNQTTLLAHQVGALAPSGQVNPPPATPPSGH